MPSSFNTDRFVPWSIQPPALHIFDFNGLNNQLAFYDWELILNNASCINAAVDNFYDILYACFNVFVPIKTTKSNTHPPWYSKQVLKLKNIKTKLHRKFKTIRLICDYNTYSVARKKLVDLQRQSFNSYTRTTELSLRNSPKKFWAYVNTRKKTSGFPSVMSRGLTKSSDAVQISELFADFFSQNFTAEAHNRTFVVKNVFDMISLGCLTLTETEVYEHLFTIDKKKGDGPDNISPLFLRNCASNLSYPLCKLFNASLSSGIFPTRWKVWRVTPIFKSGSRSNVENYRGIAILPTIGKFFESLICQLITPHLKHVITELQHGFFTGRSTTTNLIEFLNFEIDIVESGGQVDVIYTDFSKAFDRVCHAYLIA